MSASRGLPAASGGQAAARGGPPPARALRRSLAARLPASRTVRGRTAVVLSRPAGGHLLRQPQEANTPPFLLPSTPAAPSDF